MSDHVREVGPHGHAWRTIHTTGTVYLQACELCGGRRVIGNDQRFKGCPQLAPWQQAWIDGADLPKEATP